MSQEVNFMMLPRKARLNKGVLKEVFDNAEDRMYEIRLVDYKNGLIVFDNVQDTDVQINLYTTTMTIAVVLANEFSKKSHFFFRDLSSDEIINKFNKPKEL